MAPAKPMNWRQKAKLKEQQMNKGTPTKTSTDNLNWRQKKQLREQQPKQGMPEKAMKAMKAMKAVRGRSGAMSKGSLAEELATQNDLEKPVCAKLVDALVEIGAKEVKSNGKFTIPGLCVIKTRHKPATKAGKKVMFGKEVDVKAKPAKTVVKAFAVAALKREFK